MGDSGIKVDFDPTIVIVLIAILGLGFFVHIQLEQFDKKRLSEKARDEHRERQRELERAERQAEQNLQRQKELEDARQIVRDREREAERRRQQQREELILRAEAQVRKAELDQEALRQANAQKLREVLRAEADELRRLLFDNEVEAESLEVQLKSMAPPLKRAQDELEESKQAFNKLAERLNFTFTNRPPNVERLAAALQDQMQRQSKYSDEVEVKLAAMQGQYNAVLIRQTRARNIIAKTKARLAEIATVKE